ncbi:hypothetical protein CO669_05195 [Bradyrhizobium sp. Y36]|nr:hypothetical protein CO669_05195 [Bradyrhizobium sp. Y36]
MQGNAERGIRLNRARMLVAEGELQLALEDLRSLLSGIDRKQYRSSWRNLVLNLMSRRARADRDRRSGTSDDRAYDRSQNEIAIGILELIDELEQSDAVIGTYIVEQPIAISAAAMGNAEVLTTDRSRLKSVAWLRRGLDCAKSVCRVVTPNRRGTGFVVNANTLVTNHHVLETASEAADTVVEFNFEADDEAGLCEVERFYLDAATFKTSETLDCTAVKIRDFGGKWGQLTIEAGKSVKVQDHVVIVQHPQAGIKQICMTDNGVVNLFENFVQYTTDTMAGSSGSPVFNDEWRVVAIHHKGGDLAKNVAGDVIFVNQGVLMSAIVADPDLAGFICAG